MPGKMPNPTTRREKWSMTTATYLDTLSVRYNEKRHREMKTVYRKAYDALHSRLHEGDQAHGH